jgi:hypothetical protein
LDDLIVGAMYADPNGDRSGKSYIWPTTIITRWLAVDNKTICACASGNGW